MPSRVAFAASASAAICYLVLANMGNKNNKARSMKHQALLEVW